MAIEVTMAEIQPLIIDVFKADLVPNLLSSPGIGKSQLAAQIAKLFNLKLIDIRMSYYDPADLNGFPHILHKDTDRPKAAYIPMNVFPIEGDPLPIKYKLVVKQGVKEYVADGTYDGWLIIMDEFNSAPLSVQAASYKVVLDKQVGMYDLHKKVVIMTAGNLSTDKAIVNRLSTAMQSRLINFRIKVCKNAWMDWADVHDIDHRVKSFINWKPELLHKFKPNHQDLTFPCPRTWEFTSKIIKPWAKKIDSSKIPLLAGTVGEGAGQEFFSHTEVYDQIPSMHEIESDPMNCRLGDGPSIQHAVCGLIGAHMTAANAGAMVKFISRLGIEFQVTTLRSAIARDRKIRSDIEVKRWITQNADELIA